MSIDFEDLRNNFQDIDSAFSNVCSDIKKAFRNIYKR